VAVNCVLLVFGKGEHDSGASYAQKVARKTRGSRILGYQGASEVSGRVKEPLFASRCGACGSKDALHNKTNGNVASYAMKHAGTMQYT